MEVQKVIHLRERMQVIKDIKLGKLEKVQIGVSIISIIIGTLLHYIYGWFGENIFVASFSAVNASVWEHLKLIFYPMLVVGIIEYFFVNKNANNYFESKTIGIFISICFMVITFFTYTGILGTNFFIIDIIIFIASILIGEYISYKLMIREDESNVKTKILASIILLFLLICFIVCTYVPPRVNLFRDPINDNYGINNKLENSSVSSL